MYVIPAQRGAKWHLSKISERFSTFQRAKVDAGLCLATLCLLSAHLAMTPSIVRGQTQNDYGQYFQQIPEAEETIAAITGGLIDSRPSRAAESSFVNQTSSRRESRGLAAAHSPGVSDKPSDENVVSSDSAGVSTQERNNFPTDHGITHALEISPSTKTSQRPLSVEAVRKSLSKLAAAIDVGESLSQSADRGRSSRRSQPLQPSASPQPSRPLARATSTAKPAKVNPKHAIPSTLNFGHWVTTPPPRLLNRDQPKQTNRSSIMLSSFIGVSKLPTPGRVTRTQESNATSEAKKTAGVVTASTTLLGDDRKQSSRRIAPVRVAGAAGSLISRDVETAGPVATASATTQRDVFKQSSRRNPPLTAFINANRLDVMFAERTTPDHGKPRQLTSSTIFRRAPDGRLGRRRYSLPRFPKPKANKSPRVPALIVRQELTLDDTAIKSNQRSRPARLVLAAQEVRVLQPPATTDSPSDVRRPMAPADEHSVLTTNDELVAEEVLPQTSHAFDRPMEKLGTNIDAPVGEFPEDVAEARFAAAGEVSHGMGARRGDVETVIFWDAPGTAHRPLYFEEVNLERHGYRVPLIQPVLSGAHFFGRLPALPYLMFAEYHRQYRYTLGHYRPGSMAPYEWYLPRPSLDGGVVEAAAVTGLLFAFP